LESSDRPVELDLADHRLDRDLALAVEAAADGVASTRRMKS
jgi:hypothetical protein